MEKHNGKIQGHGYFRKTKAFGLASGIVLGTALLLATSTSVASADEVTSSNANVATVSSGDVAKPTQVTKVVNTQTPSDQADVDGTYNSQVKSV